MYRSHRTVRLRKGYFHVDLHRFLCCNTKRSYHGSAGFCLEAFFHSLNMPTSFSGPGIQPTEDEMRDMAHKCSAAVGGRQGSAKVLYEADMLAIYQMAAAI